MTKEDKPAPVMCVICATKKKPREATPGYLTDTRCSDQLVEALDDIARLYRDHVSDSPVPKVGADTGRRAPGFGSRSPADDTVIAMADHRTVWAKPGDLHNPDIILSGWRDVLREETGDTFFPLGPVECAQYLAKRRAWVTRQPWVADMWPEIKEVRDQLANYGGESGRVRAGRCPNLMDTGGKCGTRLYVAFGCDSIRCGGCGTVWPRTRWLLLGAMIEEAG